ncbi:EF hand domain-containing protein [Ditylenchus destructor]|uniref:EF hand domain-containing protein n=1 Tax=Ditylenchus destructor TaxID=166010 RepID=A0AAD4RAY1_9BILA|nr:EF hand domain-containing protein [Ditylenchus destructor]
MNYRAIIFIIALVLLYISTVNCSDDLEAKFKQADKDGDGKLSFDEFSIVFLGLPHDVFDKADTDKDGFITLDDLKTVVPPK